MPFSSLGLAPALVHAATDVGYFDPTAIQRAAIPAALAGQDILGLAQTGSGKTAAFSLPLLQRWAQAPRHRSRRTVHTLVLVPTRELAAQVGETLRLLSLKLHERPKIAVVFGGVSVNPQMMALRGGADIVVATPGRLLDLLVAEELQRILGVLPPVRQNLFFSATFAPAVEALAAQLLREPLRIEVEATQETEPDIAQRAIEVDAGRRTQLLRHLVQENKWTRVLAFVATKHAAETVADKLRKAGIDAEPFHGMLGQGKRTQVMQDFKASRLQVVVATDLAARGIDIAQLPVVVNYDLPRSATEYVHRIGRTGRAGESGLALSFIPADSEAHFRLIEKRQGLSLPRERIAGFEPVDAVAAPQSADAASPAGGIKGKRPSKKDKLRAAAATKP